MSKKKPTKNHNVILDYIASGFCASFRLGTPHKDFEQGICRNMVPSSQYLKDKLGGKVNISGLFNAYTEEMFANRVDESGTDFKKLFPDGIYADSGGLQVLTRGKTISEAMKQKIYNIQTKYSDYAMSFDEMPFKMVGGQRIYLPNIVSDCGIRAGENLQGQIEYFENINSKTKIFPIIQGLGLDDMSTYTLNMLNVLNEKQLNSLECLAVGGIGSEFELLERSINIFKINGIPPKIRSHFHVLGVTGFRKLMPILIGVRNGLLPGIKKFSFDSTTMSKSFLLGNIYQSLSEIKSGVSNRSLGKVRDNFVDDYYQQMWDFWKDIPNNIFDDVEDLIQHSNFQGLYNNPNKSDLIEKYTTAAQQYKNMGLEHGVKTITQKYVYVYYNTYKFLSILEDYLEGKVELSEFMGTYKHLGLLQALEKITTIEAFDDWYISVRKAVNVEKKSEDDGGDTTSFLF